MYMLQNIAVHEFVYGLDFSKLAVFSSIFASLSAILYRIAMYKKHLNNEDQELLDLVKEILDHLKHINDKDQNKNQ